ncbi:MAG: serine/threonine-protein kinase [Solirubrobacterales bacterium]
MTPEQVAGRYELERRLGHGGMATVFRARDRELGRTVALKLLADNLAGDDDVRKRFKREARLAAKLDHPNVVQVFDVGEEGDRPFIVMEHVDGGTLTDRLERRRRALPTREALPVLQQLCEGLGHAHDRGLVHRDVKPQNLLLRDEDGCLKIVDFGIARAVEDTRLTKTGLVVGTDRYMAPEQLADGKLSPATDVYACGVVADEILPANRPAALTEIVERCLREDPRERFRDATELGEALAEVNGAAAPTRPLSRLTRRRGAAPEVTERLPRTAAASPRGHARRRFPDLRSRITLAVALLVGLALAVGVFAAVDSEDSDPTDAPASGRAGQGAAVEGGRGVEPAPQLGEPSEQARAFADWLRRQGE